MQVMRWWPIALALLAALSGWQVRGWRDGASASAALQAAITRAAAREIQISAMSAQVAMEDAAYVQEVQAISERADAADLALERLRKAIIGAGGTSADPCTTCRSNGGAIERALLGDCAAEYRRVAGEADGLRARLVTLQAWARTVRK